MTPTLNDNTLLGESAAEVPGGDTAEILAQDAAPKGRGRGRTPEGRAASARNSTKHSMRAEELFPIELQGRIRAFSAGLILRHQPVDQYERSLVGIMARALAKIEHGEELEITDRIRAMERAGTEWDEIRYRAVNELASRLAKHPERISALLAGSWHGADWLVTNWLRLGDSLDSNGELDEAQYSLVHDLLGIPVVHRNGCTEVPAATDVAGLSELIKGEIQRLQDRKQGVLALRDDADQRLAMNGWAPELSKESRLNLRYVREARTVLKNTEILLLKAQAQRITVVAPLLAAATATASDAAGTPSPEPSPPPPQSSPPNPPPAPVTAAEAAPESAAVLDSDGDEWDDFDDVLPTGQVADDIAWARQRLHELKVMRQQRSVEQPRPE